MFLIHFFLLLTRFIALIRYCAIALSRYRVIALSLYCDKAVIVLFYYTLYYQRCKVVLRKKYIFWNNQHLKLFSKSP